QLWIERSTCFAYRSNCISIQKRGAVNRKDVSSAQNVAGRHGDATLGPVGPASVPVSRCPVNGHQQRCQIITHFAASASPLAQRTVRPTQKHPAPKPRAAPREQLPALSTQCHQV